MVAMPVRVKPPPADIGETVSPGCASLEITTPENGARIARSSSPCSASATPALRDADLSLRPPRAAPRARRPRPQTASSTLCGDELALDEAAVAHERLASHRRAGPRSHAGCGASPRATAFVTLYSARAVDASSLASTWPCCTRAPSSNSTSAMRPGDLGTHGRQAPRDDVARCVQDGAVGGPSGRFDHRRLHAMAEFMTRQAPTAAIARGDGGHDPPPEAPPPAQSCDSAAARES